MRVTRVDCGTVGSTGWSGEETNVAEWSGAEMSTVWCTPKRAVALERSDEAPTPNKGA